MVTLDLDKQQRTAAISSLKRYFEDKADGREPHHFAEVDRRMSRL